MSQSDTQNAINLELLHWDDPENRQYNRMGELLSKQIASSCQLDVLTGYFYFNGIPELYKALEKKQKDGKAFKLRILIGMEAQIGTKDFAQELLESTPPAYLTEAQWKARYAANLREVLHRTPGKDKTNADAGLYDRFVTMLGDKNLTLEIKQTKIPNHGKLYLFYPENYSEPKTYILGSSNFSKQGLAGRQELNIRVEKDHKRAEKLAYLYNKLWDEGSYDIIEVDPKKGSSEETNTAVTKEELEQASPYIRPTPFEAYMALMKQYLGNTVPDAELMRAFTAAVKDTNYYKTIQYQLIGAANAIRIIREHGGVLIADAVGLGKSVTAALIATQASPGGGVIIVPPTLVKEWKDEYLAKFELKALGRPWAVFSMTDLESVEEFCQKNPVSMVIVDEAHRFRNPKIEGYETLRTLCLPRQVVLMTATPFNNRPRDMKSLIDLFLPHNTKMPGTSDSVFERISTQDKTYQDLVFLQRNWNRRSRPPSVEIAFQNLIKNEKYQDIKDKKAITAILEELGKALFDTLHPYIIRRNRADLEKNKEYYEDGKPWPLPEQKVEGKYYSLTDQQNEAYSDVLNVFQNSANNDEQGFDCIIYRVAEFAGVDEVTGNYLDNYRGMALRHLLRRFESSPYAFKGSIENLIERYKAALKDLEDPNKLYFAPKGLGRDDLDEDSDGDNDNWVGKLYSRPGATGSGVPFKPGKDVEFIQGLKSDLELLEKLLEKADILLKDDPKLIQLKETIGPALTQKQGQRDAWLKPGENPEIIRGLPEGAPRRVVIFTMFIDSACHLAQELSKTYGDGVVMLAIDQQHSGEQSQQLDLSGVDVVDDAEKVKACFAAKADFANIWTAPRILVTTDKFSEGVNLNRAGVMINYDIPWNPVRIIQRLGRFNRIDACWFKQIFAYNLYPEYQRTESPMHLARADWASPQEVAAQKLIMIHQLFFEDATILGDAQAGKGKPFEAIEKEAEKGSEAASTETIVGERYREALKNNGCTDEQAIKNFEKRLIAFGNGMKTARLKAEEANMLIFKQHGALIQAEILDELHTKDNNKRMEPIDFIKALNKIESTKNDCYSEPRFPDYYETIEKRMGTPPNIIKGSTKLKKYKSLAEKAKDIIFDWQLTCLDENVQSLYSACEEGQLTEKQLENIKELGNNASEKEVKNIVAQLLHAHSHEDLTALSSQPDTAEQELILTFVNENKETEPCRPPMN